MRFLVLSTLSLTLMATQSPAMTDERKELLYDTLSLALRCDAASGLLKRTLAEEREQIRTISANAGMELGMAMLRGEIDDPDPGYGRRCLTGFAFAPAPDVDPEAAAFSIGFELGEARSCFLQIFIAELSRKVPTGPLMGGNSEQEIQDREKSQAYAREEFDTLGCAIITFPEP